MCLDRPLIATITALQVRRSRLIVSEEPLYPIQACLSKQATIGIE
jgi:hypothetical protein